MIVLYVFLKFTLKKWIQIMQATLELATKKKDVITVIIE